MIEEEKLKDLRTYTDVVYARIATDQLINGEEGIKFKKF